jgi:hypothetical protein
MYGAYADATGETSRGYGSCVSRDLCAFIESAQRNRAVPPWWDTQDCVVQARGSVHCAVEASDLAERHGNFGVLALRVLAERITGGPPGSDAGMGAPDADGEEEEEEKEEWEEDDDFGEDGEWNEDEEAIGEEDDDPLWDKGEDAEDADEAPEERDARLLQRWAGLGEQSAEEAAAFAKACAEAQRTPPRIVVLAGLSYLYHDDEEQADTFERICEAARVQSAVQATAPPGSPANIETVKAAVLAALPRAAALVVLEAEAAGAGRVLPQLRGALRAWVHAGGVLAVNAGFTPCARDAVPLLRALFPEATAGWAFDGSCEPDVERGDAVLCEECNVLLASQSPPELPPRVSADVFVLSGVPPTQRLYATAQGELCPLAVGEYGKGRVIYFGDVEGGDVIGDLVGKDRAVRAVVELATHRLKPW